MCMYRVAAPLEGIAPSEGSWFIFLLCRLEGRPIASPLKHLAITMKRFIRLCARHHMRSAPPRLAT